MQTDSAATGCPAPAFAPLTDTFRSGAAALYQESRPERTPLCVDLDGALVRTDLLIESLFALLRQRVACLFLVPIWLFKGRAGLKERIAAHADIDVSMLPYHEEFLAHLREEHARGRRLCLVTAAPRKYAEQVAQHLGIFDEVYASSASENLSAARKGRLLCRLYGEKGFDYAGNARADLAVLPHARRGMLVNPEPGVRRAAGRSADIARIFDDRTGRLENYARALRLHQWLKNLLLFVPALAAHELDNMALLSQAGIGFIVFGLCASSVYLLNDLLDLGADRRHPRKRHRPLAAGTISIKAGAALVPALLVAAFAGALALLPLAFAAALAVYYGLTLAYSFWIKGKLMADVIVLAALYTMRIIAGAAAVAIMPSFWLLALSMFLFLSLAMVKRYSELASLESVGRTRALNRNYEAGDYAMLSSLGAASGYTAVLVLALYINSDDVVLQYRHPMAFWLLCPLLLYWISRVWLLTGRGQMHDDPVVFALRDRVSRWLAATGGAILWFAA